MFSEMEWKKAMSLLIYLRQWKRLATKKVVVTVHLGQLKTIIFGALHLGSSGVTLRTSSMCTRTPLLRANNLICDDDEPGKREGFKLVEHTLKPKWQGLRTEINFGYLHTVSHKASKFSTTTRLWERRVTGDGLVL